MAWFMGDRTHLGIKQTRLCEYWIWVIFISNKKMDSKGKKVEGVGTLQKGVGDVEGRATNEL